MSAHDEEHERRMFTAGYLAAYEDIKRADREHGTLNTLGLIVQRANDPRAAEAAALNTMDQREREARWING